MELLLYLQFYTVGPLLFLLYINDLPESLKLTTPCMYADDTQIFASSPDAHKLIVKLNSNLAQVRKWLIKNKNALTAAFILACLELRSRNEEAINSKRNVIYSLTFF